MKAAAVDYHFFASRHVEVRQAGWWIQLGGAVAILPQHAQQLPHLAAGITAGTATSIGTTGVGGTVNPVS